MKFVVTASRYRLLDPPRNPFITPIENFGKGTLIKNTLEVEAESEEQVRELWATGQKEGWSNVAGFTIDKIEKET